MDVFVIVGILISFGSLIVGFLLEGGEMHSLFLLPPFIIVVGGTLGVVFTSFRITDILGAGKALAKTFRSNEGKAPDLVIEKIVHIAQVCRAEGLLKMQDLVQDPELSRPDFLPLKAGMIMAMDMKTADEIEAALEADIAAFASQRQMEAAVFTSAGGTSPTMGVVGTVMGLVHVLGGMEDPDKLVVAIGSAFIATLYGVALANLVYLPAATRIKNMLKREQLMREMIADGICMVVRGEGARSIENKLSVYYQAFPGGFKKYSAGIEK